MGNEVADGFSSFACPFCGHPGSQVKDSRPVDEGTAVRRRRLCPGCGQRWTTHERRTVRRLMVHKRNGRYEAFDGEKIRRCIHVAMARRPPTPWTPDQIAARIVDALERLGDETIGSDIIGEIVLKNLRIADEVAFVRFASVYRNFNSAAAFAAFIQTEGLT